MSTDTSQLLPIAIKVLKQAGWTPDRNNTAIEEEYKRILGDSWLPAAAFFVSNLGGLRINYSSLWVEPERAILDILNKERIENIVKYKVCPVAVSYYTGDTGGTIWIDSQGKIYHQDDEGLMFLGHNVNQALNVLLVPGIKRPEPPPDIAEALEAAYEWNLRKPIE